ncbi:MAG: GNAT family N-acetyltransferase [Planctomycetaceae bacterium]|nr:GNAT family N-acetyltransferase [Planctomycetaceae bacterium]
MLEVEIRTARPHDCDVIVDYNCRLAEETESKTLDRETVFKGVTTVISDNRKGRYFVACHNGQVVGQLMHTYEWSDWRNGDIWWIQSVYVNAGFRRQGVYRQLYEHLSRQAESSAGVAGIRLYVEVENDRAQATYESLGMRKPGYLVMESIR